MRAQIFVGRKQELSALKNLHRLRQASLVTILGRRRIGKSKLVNHFCAIHKIPIYEFQGLPPRPGMTSKDQLNHFAQTLAGYLNIKGIEFADWTQALRTLSELKTSQKTVVFLDEISWMGIGDPDFAGKIKIAWDTLFSSNPNLLLILCGSVSSWIEKNISKNTGFAGRVSLQIHLNELSIRESGELLRAKGHSLRDLDLAQILSVTGGVPRYLEEMSPKRSVDANILGSFFHPTGFLFLEFEKTFSEIFGRRHPLYRKILLALKGGPLSPSELADRTGLPVNGDLIEYLADLETGGFVHRDYTWNFKGEASKLSRIRVSDAYTRFYLKYIHPFSRRLQSKPVSLDESLSSYVQWPVVFGYQFENLMQNHMAELVEALGIPSSEIVHLGPYHQTKTKAKEGVQVDLLVQCKRHVLHMVEMKSGAKIRKDVIAEVTEKQRRLKIPRGFSVRHHLIHLGDLEDSIQEADFFDQILAFSDLS